MVKTESQNSKYSISNCLLLTGWVTPVLALLLFAICVVPSRADSFSLSMPKTISNDPDYNQAVAHLQNNNLGAAEVDFKKSLQHHPNNASALLGLAKIALQRQQVRVAGEYLQRAVATTPRDANVRATWAHYLFFQKHYPEAEAAYKKAIALDPGAVRPRLELGDLYLTAMRLPEQAILTYQGALGIGPDTVRVHYMLGHALAEAGKLKDAQSEFEKSLQLDPNNPLLYDALGHVYVGENDRDKALQAYASSLETQPAAAGSEVPRRDYTFITSSRENQAAVYFKIGLTEQSYHRRALAEEDYRKAIELNPKLAPAYNNLAFLAAEQRTDLDEALRFAEQAVELDTKVPTFLDTLGWVYRARGERQQAISELSKASSLAPRDPQVWYHLGVVYAEVDRSTEALMCLNKALQLSQAFPEAANARKQIEKIKGARR